MTHPRSNGGAPHKLTAARRDAILKAIRSGCSYAVAARVGGVHADTLKNWIDKGEAGTAPVYVSFVAELRDAEAACEAALVASWMNQATGQEADWRAARDFLARRFPERWAPVVKEEHSGQVDHRLVPQIADPVVRQHAIEIRRHLAAQAEAPTDAEPAPG